MVRQYAGREDLRSDEMGLLLRVFEAHELVVQAGNRWQIPKETSQYVALDPCGLSCIAIPFVDVVK